MVTCPATTEQNDGDKSRKNGPGKISTFSVGQGETPGNLLTVIHKARKSLFKMFLLGGYDCASKPGTDNGDKSKLQFPCHSTFLLRYLMTCEFPLARPLGCRPCRSRPSGSILRLCVCFPPIRNLCNLWTLWFPNSKIRSFKLSKKLNRKVFSKPSVSSRVRRTRTLRSWVASACSTCAPTII